MVDLRRQSVVLSAAVVLTLLVGPPVPTAAATAHTYENGVVDETNTERTARSLSALRRSGCLDGYAERQAQAMARQQRLHHQPMTPVLDRCGLSRVGENVAVGFSGGADTTRAWLASTSHHDNLLDPGYRLIGVGACQDARGVWFVSQVFGTAA